MRPSTERDRDDEDEQGRDRTTRTALASVAISLATVSLAAQRLSENVSAAYLEVIGSYETRRALEQVPSALDPMPPALIDLDRGVWVLAVGALIVAAAGVMLIPRRSHPWRISALALLLALVSIWAQWRFTELQRWSRLETPRGQFTSSMCAQDGQLDAVRSSTSGVT